MWTEIKSLDLRISNFTVVHRNGELIIIGGYDVVNNQKISNVNIYSQFPSKSLDLSFTLFSLKFQVRSIDVGTGEIADFPPLISARIKASAELINGSIYVFCGLINGSFMGARTVERHDNPSLRMFII